MFKLTSVQIYRENPTMYFTKKFLFINFQIINILSKTLEFVSLRLGIIGSLFPNIVRGLTSTSNPTCECIEKYGGFPIDSLWKNEKTVKKFWSSSC